MALTTSAVQGCTTTSRGSCRSLQFGVAFSRGVILCGTAMCVARPQSTWVSMGQRFGSREAVNFIGAKYVARVCQGMRMQCPAEASGSSAELSRVREQFGYLTQRCPGHITLAAFRRAWVVSAQADANRGGRPPEVIARGRPAREQPRPGAGAQVVKHSTACYGRLGRWRGRQSRWPHLPAKSPERQE